MNDDVEWKQKRVDLTDDVYDASTKLTISAINIRAKFHPLKAKHCFVQSRKMK